MQSSGSTSSQTSSDSLSSSDSFLFGDGEHAEDEGGAFLAERRPGGGAPCSAVRGSAGSPASQWACDGFSDRERCSPLGGGGRAERRRSGDASSSSYSALVSSSSAARTEGDHLFARKCVELQGFIRPLLDLLNGLKKGRFDRGLSSFQQSVAMDRIQRIVGVLQKPTIGGKYLHTLLQVEMMLKLWFPQISPCAPSTSERSAPPHSTPPHKHRDQLHIPVKKRRLSWSDTDPPTPPPLRCKRFDHRGGQERGPAGGEEGRGPAPPAGSGAEGERGAGGYARRAAAEEREREHRVIRWSELSAAWVRVNPALGPPESCSSHRSRGGAAKGRASLRASSPPSAAAGPATQDSSVSSTTPFSDPHRLLLLQCQPVACQSRPVATETEDCEGGASKAGQGRSQSLPPALKPLDGGGRARTCSPTQT